MPADSDPDQPEPVDRTDPGESPLLARHRPRGVRVVGAVVFTVLALSPVLTWIFLPQSARDRFVVLDFVLLTFVAALFVASGHAVLRCRVDVTERGLLVVNGYRSHDLRWADVERLGLPSGAPFARVETVDGRSINMLGVQGSDGQPAKDAVRAMRREHADRTRPAG